MFSLVALVQGAPARAAFLADTLSLVILMQEPILYSIDWISALDRAGVDVGS